MKKSILFVLAFFVFFGGISAFILWQSEHASKEEGFLYSAIGCTSVFKKLDRGDKVETMLNLVHHFSAREGIEATQPGYLTRFIKLVEKKWEKENELAQKNCSGIYTLALEEKKPAQYNAVAMSVIEYMKDLESNKKETATEKAERVIKEQGLEKPLK
ncbi:exported hypothetical protein [Candidatus Terasakiella magnetica]|uniref:Uncharacterized protein n=1 Tax=Candidatus Terasakiella magnetica TaxID=1867952 RepID=A0A1C3RD53_9PROT|nr:hypothetical protein [Candidatus Terasakiella magnetica]SCA55220.1 exported hypothetical protein [Candidatus Terasakiella magnetica]